MDKEKSFVEAQEIPGHKRKKVFIRILAGVLITILVVSLGAFIAVAYTNYNHEDLYQSTTKLYVQIEDKNGDSFNSTATTNRVEAYQIVLKSRTTLEDVIATIQCDYPDYSLTYGRLSGMVATSADGETEIFTVTVTSRSKEEAYLVAEALIKVMQNRIPALFGSGSKVGVADSPVVSNAPIAPSYQKNVLIGSALGFVFSLVKISPVYCTVIIIKELSNNKFAKKGRGDVARRS